VLWLYVISEMTDERGRAASTYEMDVRRFSRSVGAMFSSTTNTNEAPNDDAAVNPAV